MHGTPSTPRRRGLRFATLALIVAIVAMANLRSGCTSPKPLGACRFPIAFIPSGGTVRALEKTKEPDSARCRGRNEIVGG